MEDTAFCMLLKVPSWPRNEMMDLPSVLDDGCGMNPCSLDSCPNYCVLFGVAYRSRTKRHGRSLSAHGQGREYRSWQFTCALALLLWWSSFCLEHLPRF